MRTALLYSAPVDNKGTIKKKTREVAGRVDKNNNKKQRNLKKKKEKIRKKRKSFAIHQSQVVVRVVCAQRTRTPGLDRTSSWRWYDVHGVCLLFPPSSFSSRLFIYEKKKKRKKKNCHRRRVERLHWWKINSWIFFLLLFLLLLSSFTSPKFPIFFPLIFISPFSS